MIVLYTSYYRIKKGILNSILYAIICYYMIYYYMLLYDILLYDILLYDILLNAKFYKLNKK